jgi:hypothetical protein
VTKRESSLRLRLERATDGLVYQSETDAALEPVLYESRDGEAIDAAALAALAGIDAGAKVEEIEVDDFFAPLVAIEDWYGEDEKRAARRFARLERLLKRALDEPRVYRFGEREIDIFVVGRAGGEIAGVRTKAVET